MNRFVNRLTDWFRKLDRSPVAANGHAPTAEFAGDGSGASPLAMISGGSAIAANSSVIGQPIGWSGSILDTVSMPPDAEVVSANGTWTGIGAMNMQVLANNLNVRGERLDPTVIEAMMDDPAVKASVDSIRVQMFCGELRFRPAIKEQADPDADDDPEGGSDLSRGDPKIARQAAEFLERAHKRLDVPVPIWAWGFADYLTYGHKVAEIVLEEQKDGPDVGMYYLRALKVKARWAYHLCTDPYLNLVALYAQTIWGPAYIDKKHFFVMSNKPLDSDPRGGSELRGAKEPWRRKYRRLKSQCQGDDQFGYPIPVYELPPNVPIESEKKRRDGTPMTTTEAGAKTLEGLHNGKGFCHRNGGKLYPFQSSQDGAQISKNIQDDNREIILAITGTNGSGLLEPKHYSQNSGEHAEAKERGLADFHRDAFLAAYKTQVCHYILEENFGKEYADLYTPELSIGMMPMDEFLKLASALGLILQSGGFTQSQWDHLLAEANVPPPRKDELRIGPNGPIPATVTAPEGSIQHADGKVEQLPFNPLPPQPEPAQPMGAAA